MTNSDLIKGALALIGVLGEGEDPSAEQGALGIQVLNGIMADWEQDGVNLEYYPQETLGDETPVPAHALVGVQGFLAVALAPYYGKPITAEFIASNEKFYSRLVRDAVRDSMEEADLSHRPLGEARWF